MQLFSLFAMLACGAQPEPVTAPSGIPLPTEVARAFEKPSKVDAFLVHNGRLFQASRARPTLLPSWSAIR